MALLRESRFETPKKFEVLAGLGGGFQGPLGAQSACDVIPC